MKVTYNETLNLPDDIIAKLPEEIKKEFKKPIVYNLYYDGNNSSYTIASNPKEVKVKDLENTNNSNSFTITEFAVYKDYSKNMIISKTELIKKQYLINKPFYTEKWVLKNEFKKIGDLNCKKAEIILNNEKIIAYYSEEIPISEGPSIYFGLPGLIIHLEAPDRIYSMSKFEKLTDIKIEKFKNGIEITDKEFKILASKTQKSTEIIENN
jgi:GLPGLI family protein